MFYSGCRGESIQKLRKCYLLAATRRAVPWYLSGGAFVLVLLLAYLATSSRTEIAHTATYASPSASPSLSADTPPRAPEIDAAKASPPQLGVQFHGTWDMYYLGIESAIPNSMFHEHLHRLRRNNVRVLRVDVSWSRSQPENVAPSEAWYYNQRVQRVVREAKLLGMEVLLTIYRAPAWARMYPSGNPDHFPDDPRKMAAWATWMARTYGSDVRAWEVWNEPNLERFTNLHAEKRAVKYASVLKAVFSGLKAGDSDATVVFGAPSYSDVRFLRDVYEEGAQPYFDVMAVHPYQGDQTVPPESEGEGRVDRVTAFSQVISVMEKYGDAKKPVWWTEFGYSVHANTHVPADRPWERGVPDAYTAASYLWRTFELARSRYPQVRLAVVYTAYKDVDSDHDHQRGYSVLQRDGEALPQLKTVGFYATLFAQKRSLQ